MKSNMYQYSCDIWRMETVVLFEINLVWYQPVYLVHANANGTQTRYIPLDQDDQNQTSIGKVVVGAVGILLLLIGTQKEMGQKNWSFIV